MGDDRYGTDNGSIIMKMKRRHLWLIFITSLVIIVAIIVAISVSISSPKNIVLAPSSHSQTATPPKTSTTQNNTIAHIFIIMDENQPYPNIVGNSAAPYLNSLIQHYSLATNYHAVAHPSLPNYIALTSGSTDGLTTDCNPPSAGCEVNVPNIADSIENSGRTWKEYAESMPSACYAYNSGEYATKHNPFLYYTDIINNPTRCAAHVVPFTQLTTDLKSAQTTPDFAYITPNQCSDMHSCSIATGDSWLAQYVPIILSSPAFTSQNSLLVITWDEGNASTNHVATIFAGSAAKNGYQSAQYYTHYSLLHTIETLWGLAPLTNNDKQAPVMTEFIK